MNWNQFVQLTVNGLTTGGVYALVALGFTMVYGVLKLLNFAHGDVYMVGAFVGFFVLQFFGGAQGMWLPLPLVFLAMWLSAAATCGTLGIAIERYAYRPLRNAPRFAPLITALGISFLLQNSALLVFGAQYRSYGSYELAGGRLASDGIHVGVVNVSILRLLVISLAAALMLVLHLLVHQTRIGRAMRATAIDAEAASMMGVDVDRVISTTFFVGSALAGIAGVSVGLVFNNVYHFMGFTAGLKGFTAAVIGGIGSIAGAMCGGLLVGLLESYATGYLPQGATFQDFWVFLVLIAFLLVRPNGLLGRAEVRRA